MYVITKRPEVEHSATTGCVSSIKFNYPGKQVPVQRYKIRLSLSFMILHGTANRHPATIHQFITTIKGNPLPLKLRISTSQCIDTYCVTKHDISICSP